MKQRCTGTINNLDDFWGDCFSVVYQILEGETVGGNVENEIEFIKQSYCSESVLAFVEKNRTAIIDKIGTRSLRKRHLALRTFEDYLRC